MSIVTLPGQAVRQAMKAPGFALGAGGPPDGNLERADAALAGSSSSDDEEAGQ
jgi:hypothetical protein